MLYPLTLCDPWEYGFVKISGKKEKMSVKSMFFFPNDEFQKPICKQLLKILSAKEKMLCRTCSLNGVFSMIYQKVQNFKSFQGKELVKTMWWNEEMIFFFFLLWLFIYVFHLYKNHILESYAINSSVYQKLPWFKEEEGGFRKPCGKSAILSFPPNLLYFYLFKFIFSQSRLCFNFFIYAPSMEKSL